MKRIGILAAVTASLIASSMPATAQTSGTGTRKPPACVGCAERARQIDERNAAARAAYKNAPRRAPTTQQLEAQRRCAALRRTGPVTCQ